MSFILSQILKRKVPDWNERILNDDDFYLTCERSAVNVIENENLKCKGEYTIYKNVSFIVLKKGLKPEMLRWVGFHELGHHLLHYPVNHRFSKSLYRRMDREANYFAAIALIPTRVVEVQSFDEIVNEYNYPAELITIRKEIYDTYRI